MPSFASDLWLLVESASNNARRSPGWYESSLTMVRSRTRNSSHWRCCRRPATRPPPTSSPPWRSSNTQPRRLHGTNRRTGRCEWAAAQEFPKISAIGRIAASISQASRPGYAPEPTGWRSRSAPATAVPVLPGLGGHRLDRLVQRPGTAAEHPEIHGGAGAPTNPRKIGHKDPRQYRHVNTRNPKKRPL